jgi:uncharacterized membrane protein required for colicin V production
MEITTFDYVLLAIVGALAVIGLFKGFSGWLGTLTGAAIATLAGYLCFGYCHAAAVACPWVSDSFVQVAAAVLDFLLSLIVFGLVRLMAVKFFSFLLPQPLDAIIGMIGGLLLGGVLVVLLAGTAFFEGGNLKDGFVAANSGIVHFVASAIDNYLEGLQT